MFPLAERNDILAAANAARVYLRHYARGSYHVPREHLLQLPVNRMLFPLLLPKGRPSTIRDRKQTLVMRPDKFYFIPAFHEAEVQLNDDLRFLSIQSNLEVFPGTELFSGCGDMLELSSPAELPLLLELFGAPEEKRIFAALKCKGAVLSLLLSLLELYPEEAFRTPLSLRHYPELMEFLRQNGDATTRVSDLAAISHESREGFTRRFSAATGITPKQLIGRFLMSRALELLNGNGSLKEIAAELNFSSEFAFSRFFKTQMGEAPSHWRLRNARF